MALNAHFTLVSGVMSDAAIAGECLCNPRTSTHHLLKIQSITCNHPSLFQNFNENERVHCKARAYIIAGLASML
jgi:hypothetical protein